ncbi:MAG: hypothetical protein J2P52_07420, partial [Blastocatellia bacterium]|nr:hypothetical protein [Blastocatellia bacterium]
LDEAIEWHEKLITAMQKHDPKRAKETISGHLRAAQLAWAREYRQGNNGKVVDGDKAGKKK